MNLIVHPVSQPQKLQGEVHLPASKSHSVRALFLAVLASGESYLSHILAAADTRVAMEVCRQLGAEIEVLKKDPVTGNLNLRVKSHGAPFLALNSAFFTGNSGITTTFLLPLLGLCRETGPAVLDAGEQMKRRPISGMVDGVNELGMEVQYIEGNGALPLRVGGRLHGGETLVDGLNSQVISGLLLNLPFAPEDSCITVRDLHERPYVEMTLARLRSVGILITHRCENDRGVDVFSIRGGQHVAGFETSMPADFSSASYFLLASVVLGGEVIFPGLHVDETQADSALVSILQRMGADIRILLDHIEVHGGAVLHGIEIDCMDIPDLFPTLMVLGTQAEGETVLTNIECVRIKETDRLHSMVEGLRTMGAEITMDHRSASDGGDRVLIRKSRLHGGSVRGYDDHRTVMALTIAGLFTGQSEDETEDGSGRETNIDTAEATLKSFPGFVSLLQSLGAHVISSPSL